ncbi:MAG: nuclear transport factor 2 family protein [Acidobacteria bacterium]|nr:nuclear transport factor 2 family protein [Acidobacteriota bacterium]
MDETLIRNLFAGWQRLTIAEDIDAILKLMAEDVVYLTQGNPPMRGREALAASLRQALQHATIHPSRHATTANPPSRKGFTLSVLRRKPDRGWEMSRDANLLC